ncbi:MAG: glycogen synthase GlgA [Roseiarcus sp.]|jgi:starch synthase
MNGAGIAKDCAKAPAKEEPRASGQGPGRLSRRVLFVTPEMSDFVKVGGLGVVSAALPRALRRFADVRVLIPGYREVVEGRSSIERVAELPGLAEIPGCGLGRLTAEDGLVVYVLLCPQLFERPGTPYADPEGAPWPDADVRFGRLSLAAAQMAAGLGDPSWTPAVLHLNDWPTAMAAGYLEWLGVRTPSVVTIHNLAFQGLFPRERLAALGVPERAFAQNGIEFHGQLSYLKAGIYYASHVTTVSETYAREITRLESGCGLHGLLAGRAREGKLTGILNGIEDDWGLAASGGGAAPADPDAWKQANAEAVRKSFGLAVSKGPLFAIISRLVHQKGVDLSIEAADEIVAAGGQIVATGSGEKRFEQALLDLHRRHPEAIGASIGFDDDEARRMFAGSDFLLMPSRFEPCGLTQMYAQKSGSLPIAHRTGGLADTIDDDETGFLFDAETADALSSAVRRATTAFASRGRFKAMRRRAMSRDFAWTRPAGRYGALYQSLG